MYMYIDFNNQDLGMEIRRIRTKILEYSRRKLGEMLNVSGKLVYDWENNVRKMGKYHQDNLRKLVCKRLLDKNRLIVREPAPIPIKTMYEYMLCGRPEFARELGEYILSYMDKAHDDWVRLCNFTSIAYSWEDECSVEGFKFAELAFHALDSRHPRWLKNAVTNEVLGHRFKRVDKNDVDECEKIFQIAMELHDECEDNNNDEKISYLWNGLMVLCICNALHKKIPELLEVMYKISSRKNVNKRINDDSIFFHAKTFIW